MNVNHIKYSFVNVNHIKYSFVHFVGVLIAGQPTDSETLQAFLKDGGSGNVATELLTREWDATEGVHRPAPSRASVTRPCSLASRNRVVYNEILKTHVPKDERVVLWTNCYGKVHLWEAPLSQEESLKKDLQDQFWDFRCRSIHKVLEGQVKKTVKLGFKMGLSKTDLIEIIDEVVVDEIMET